MVFDFYTKKIKVFVSEASDDVSVLKDRLLQVLSRAGMEVLYVDLDKINGSEELIEENRRLLNSSDCSVHILGNQSINDGIGQNEISLVEYQLQEAQKRKNSEWRDFKIFIWHPAFIANASDNDDQDEFISSVRQGIMHNMIYSSRDSVVSFVEDIRSVMYGGTPEHFDVDKADIFFIYNGIDLESANEILSMIADVMDVKKLEIILSEDIDYSELVAQQVRKSKLVVIYYKDTADWALPFVQQVWKKTGGASSPVPILFIGDSNIPLNSSIEFEAPNVVSQLVSQEIIPIEIKVQFDKLSE
ncbi:MAG: hypothetical protein HC831_19890 [Chloroflexia bacterium]|nr:hypothetical protein [Chloroflexia bacterium]